MSVIRTAVIWAVILTLANFALNYSDPWRMKVIVNVGAIWAATGAVSLFAWRKYQSKP